MIRQEWSLIGLVVCAIVGLAVLAPLVPCLVGSFVTFHQVVTIKTLLHPLPSVSVHMLL